jgi:regulator of replication initiation timing
MPNEPQTLTPCEAALATHALQLSGEELEAGQAQRAEEHFALCASCREAAALNAQALGLARGAFSAVRVSVQFTAKTMAALPQTATASTQVRVFGSTPVRSSSWRPVAVAASLALIAVGGVLAMTILKSPPVVAVSTRGTLVDSAGRDVKSIQTGLLCSARENTLLRVENEGTLNVLKGTRFEFRREKNNGAVEMELHNGEVYAQASGSDGVHVACANFQTEVPEGDCFVTQETDNVTRGVVIVFTGRANVTPNLQAALPLKSGQVFFSVGEGPSAFMDTLELGDIPKLVGTNANEANVDAKTLRKQYSERVEGYRRELAELKKLDEAKKADDPQKPELSMRLERISGYLRAHELRLKSLAQAETPGHGIPLNEIERGINGHTDPQTWR